MGIKARDLPKTTQKEEWKSKICNITSSKRQMVRSICDGMCYDKTNRRVRETHGTPFQNGGRICVT
jgi:hypothetical protein